LKSPKLLAAVAAGILLSSTLSVQAVSLPATGAPTVTPLAPVNTADPHFGIVQAFEAPGVALNAGAKWERVPFFWNMAQPASPTAGSPTSSS
jgi:hypothetical protein